ncbi:hypothetical protein [Nostoc sp.]
MPTSEFQGLVFIMPRSLEMMEATSFYTSLLTKFPTITENYCPIAY